MPQKSKPTVIKTPKVCAVQGCPLCTPLGLGLFFVGFMVVFYTKWPYQIIGWVVVALAYLQAIVKIRFQ
ncbi:MAG: hypothetical protein V1744_01660 [Candidatus Altiarchaeota archaeon]